jgi:hypothetical protein
MIYDSMCSYKMEILLIQDNVYIFFNIKLSNFKVYKKKNEEK